MNGTQLCQKTTDDCKKEQKQTYNFFIRLQKDSSNRDDQTFECAQGFSKRKVFLTQAVY